MVNEIERANIFWREKDKVIENVLEEWKNEDSIVGESKGGIFLAYSFIWNWLEGLIFFLYHYFI